MTSIRRVRRSSASVRRVAMGAVFALATASCSAEMNPGDGGNGNDVRRTDGSTDVGDGTVGDAAERCAPGVDSDRDGITNDVECMLGSDPFNADSDMDGLRDGAEAMYPRICVATDRAMQRRPVVTCVNDMQCMTGERCLGLNPASNDSDGDGVRDGEEDVGLDGTIDQTMGETDPRLWDTDGDGMNDSMGGLDICRPSGLANVVQITTPPGTIQIGHDPVFGSAPTVMGTMMRGAVILNDPATDVSAVIFSVPSGMPTVRDESARIEAAITAALGAGVTPVLVGRPITTHEMQPALTSTFRVARAGASSSALRDSLVMPLIGAAAPAGPMVGASGEFYVDVTTVLHTMGRTMGRTDVAVAIAPRASFDDPMRATSIRSNDVVNTTALAEADRAVGNACQVFRAERSSMADFIWTVDTSGSMGDDQLRLANVAVQFFRGLQSAGVDFRVGVLQAGSNVMGPTLDTPGFAFISGTDPNGPRLLCEQVTDPASGTDPATMRGWACPMTPGETVAPYRFAGGQEEPTAAAVIAHNLFERNTSMMVANPDRRFRDGARIVTFHVTDEPGSNDFTRYFDMTNDPETAMPWGTAYDMTSLGNIVQYFRRNEILTFGLVPVNLTGTMPRPCSMLNVADLPRCVVEGNGGAVIPIATATDAEISAAMARIVDAVAGATSQFRLTRSPITSTIQVRVGGRAVPRSRNEGFDYDAASRSIVFYGNMFRPRMGDQVVISYRVWEGSLG